MLILCVESCNEANLKLHSAGGSEEQGLLFSVPGANLPPHLQLEAAGVLRGRGLQGGGQLGCSRPQEQSEHPARPPAARPLPPHVHGRGGAELQVSSSQEKQESRHRSRGGQNLSCKGRI